MKPTEPRLILTGDKRAAAAYVRFGQKLLTNLKTDLDESELSLSQGKNSKVLPGGGLATVRVVGSQSEIHIDMPFEGGEEKKYQRPIYKDKHYLYYELFCTRILCGIYEVDPVCFVWDIEADIYYMEPTKKNVGFVKNPAVWGFLDSTESVGEPIYNPRIYHDENDERCAELGRSSDLTQPVNPPIIIQSSPPCGSCSENGDVSQLNQAYSNVIQSLPGNLTNRAWADYEFHCVGPWNTGYQYANISKEIRYGDGYEWVVAKDRAGVFSGGAGSFHGAPYGSFDQISLIENILDAPCTVKKVAGTWWRNRCEHHSYSTPLTCNMTYPCSAGYRNHYYRNNRRTSLENINIYTQLAHDYFDVQQAGGASNDFYDWTRGEIQLACCVQLPWCQDDCANCYESDGGKGWEMWSGLCDTKFGADPQWIPDWSWIRQDKAAIYDCVYARWQSVKTAEDFPRRDEVYPGYVLFINGGGPGQPPLIDNHPDKTNTGIVVGGGDDLRREDGLPLLYYWNGQDWANTRHLQFYFAEYIEQNHSSARVALTCDGGTFIVYSGHSIYYGKDSYRQTSWDVGCGVPGYSASGDPFYADRVISDSESDNRTFTRMGFVHAHLSKKRVLQADIARHTAIETAIETLLQYYYTSNGMNWEASLHNRPWNDSESNMENLITWPILSHFTTIPQLRLMRDAEIVGWEECSADDPEAEEII